MASDPGGSRYAKGERVHHRAPDVSGTFSVRVLNLPWDAMKEEVYFTFEKFGAIEDVHLPKDAGGRPKGFAFVRFRDLQSAEEAIQRLDGKPFLGRGRMVRDARTMKVHQCKLTKGGELTEGGLEGEHERSILRALGGSRDGRDDGRPMKPEATSSHYRRDSERHRQRQRVMSELDREGRECWEGEHRGGRRMERERSPPRERRRDREGGGRPRDRRHGWGRRRGDGGRGGGRH